MVFGILMIAHGILAQGSPWLQEPPPGPTDKAICPVTGRNFTITSDTAALEFNNGQKLYFASQEAAEAYGTNPRAYWLSPFEMPMTMPDGARGLPDLRGSTLLCPFSGETIDVGMKSLRVDHRYGQAVYFCCHGCVTRFWSDPQSVFATSKSDMEDVTTLTNMLDGPPPGPSNEAACPVTGQNLTITADTASVEFHNGQKLYFASPASAQAYRANPRAFWLSPFEMPVAMPDGGRGLPDLRGSTLYCPFSNESIDVGMKSLRFVHRYGQAVYFCCHGCATRFWSDPQSAFAESLPALV